MTSFEGLLLAVFVPPQQFAQTDSLVTICLLAKLDRGAEPATRRLVLLGIHERLAIAGLDEEVLPD